MVTKRSCYQCGDEDLEEVRARRREQVQAWAAQQIAEADAYLTKPQSSDWDDIPVTQEAPEEQTLPTVVEHEEVVRDPLSETEEQVIEPAGPISESAAKVDDSLPAPVKQTRNKAKKEETAAE